MKPARTTKPKKPTVVVIAGPNGAGKSTAAPFLLKQALGILDNASGTLKPIAHGQIALALTQASSQAKKQLASHGLKLPTQNWTGSTIRNPAV